MQNQTEGKKTLSFSHLNHPLKVVSVHIVSGDDDCHRNETLSMINSVRYRN